MRVSFRLITALWLVFGAGPVGAQQVDPPDPFFADDAVIDATLTAPMETLTRERPDEEEVPGRFLIDGKEYTIQVRTRGKFRRQKEICKFPPIRLNFKKSETKRTQLHGIDKVKLVTHCRDNSPRYEQTVLREYVAYRILNILTDASFRARLLRLTYVDSEGRQRNRTSYAIILEHRDRLAKRLDRPHVETPSTTVEKLDPRYLNLASIYQYMIGNTDFSPIAAAPDENCCHNFVLFGGSDQLYLAIPYDFDQAGLINAPHAGPNPRFGLRDVRQRLYRGRCENNAQLPDTIAFVVAKQDEIYDMIRDLEGLTKNSGRGMISYLGRFYKTVQNPKTLDRHIVKACI